MMPLAIRLPSGLDTTRGSFQQGSNNSRYGKFRKLGFLTDQANLNGYRTVLAPKLFCIGSLKPCRSKPERKRIISGFARLRDSLSSVEGDVQGPGLIDIAQGSPTFLNSRNRVYQCLWNGSACF